MKQHGVSMFDRIRRHYYHLRGERVLLTTFWPQDYRRGTVYPVNHPTYRITRYTHATDQRMFEVWGQPLAQAHPNRSPHRSLPASTQRSVTGAH
jgi:hypothetical protein